MRNVFALISLGVLTGFSSSPTIRAQDLAKEALATFLPDTIRIEYASPAKLRSVPNYEGLRARYVGPRLRELEDSFSKLGVPKGDINEVMLSWRPGTSTMDLSGFVVGRFTGRQIADRAGANGIAATPVGNSQAFCLDAGGAATCVVVLRDSLGLFGSQASLAQMLDVREGNASSLASENRFPQMIGGAPTQSPIWGVAVGVAVADFFRAWLPAQGNLELNWASVFQPVEALIYSVDTAENVRMDARLECASDQSAESTRQVFEGLRMVQQMAWQNMNPGRPNPFQSLEIARNGRRLSLKMASSFADLQSFAPAAGGL